MTENSTITNPKMQLILDSILGANVADKIFFKTARTGTWHNPFLVTKSRAKAEWHLSTAFQDKLKPRLNGFVLEVAQPAIRNGAEATDPNIDRVA